MNDYSPRHRAETPDRSTLGNRLFPPRRVPSFAEVVGPGAAEAYRREMEDRNAQELANRRQSRAALGLGPCSVEKLLTPTEQAVLEHDIKSKM